MKKLVITVGALSLLAAACGNLTASDPSDQVAGDATKLPENVASDEVTPLTGGTVEIVMKDVAFEPTSLEVKAGSTIEFVFRNDGQIAHEALIGDEQTQAEHAAEMAQGAGHDDEGMGHDDEGMGHDDEGMGHDDEGMGHADEGMAAAEDGHQDDGHQHEHEGDESHNDRDKAAGEEPKGDDEAMAHDGAEGGHDHMGSASVISLQPGKTGTLKYTFDQPGTFEIACHVPGHYEAGMVITVEVIA